MEGIELGFRGFLGVGKVALLQSRPAQPIGDGTAARFRDHPEGFYQVAHPGGHRKFTALTLPEGLDLPTMPGERLKPQFA